MRTASEQAARSRPSMSRARLRMARRSMAAATSTHATNVHLIKNLSYDPVKNFTPIIELVETIGSSWSTPR